jgi:hypothetical protein
MKTSDIVRSQSHNPMAGQKLFAARLKIKQPGYTQLIDTTIVAKNMQMAIKLLTAQYGKNTVMGNPRIVKYY